MDQEQDLGIHPKRWLLGIIAKAQQDGATDMVMAPDGQGGAAIRQKVEETWHDWGGFRPSWPEAVAVLSGLAGLREQPFPKQGIIYLAHSGVRLRWEVYMTSGDTGCFLHHLGGELL